MMRTVVPGGKMLARLHLFSEQRGFAVHAPIVETMGPSLGGSGRREEGAFSAEDIATLYTEGIHIRGVEAEVPPEPQAPVLPIWQLLGPTRIRNVETDGSSLVDASGRVSAVTVDPTDGNHILCGSAGGGVWETRDGGNSWAPRTDKAPTLTTGAIAFDPRSTNVVYTGTGEGDFYAGLGAGLLRSTNGGTTWTIHASAPFVGSGFHGLIVDPASSTHLLAATTSGLYESTDGGRNWTCQRTARTWAISMHPSGGSLAEVLAASSDGLYRSTDGGQTWTLVNLPGIPVSLGGQTSIFPAPSKWVRLAIDHARSNPSIAYAFGAAERGEGGRLAPYLYRRDLAGNWQSIPLPRDLNTHQAWYNWFVAAAPDRDNQVYLGARNLHRGDFSGTSWTWTNLSAQKSGDSIHYDQHVIAFHPTDSNIIFVGNDGGCYRSPNRGINWQSLNNGLAIAEFEYIAHDLGSSRWLMGGTQDNGTNRYVGSSIWDHIAEGDGGDCAVNDINPNIIFHSFYGMGLRRSNDRGESWQKEINIASRNFTSYRQILYPPMESRGNTVSQAGESVFISRDNGDSWMQVALPGRLADEAASALYLPTADQVFVGTTEGRVFRINWNGSAWGVATELTSPRSNAWVSDLFIDSNNANRIWATYSTITSDRSKRIGLERIYRTNEPTGGGHVFRSDDGGITWTDQSTGLPNLPINAVEVDSRNPNRVWVAADVGVYQSLDSGASWSAFSNGLPNALVVDLAYHPHARLLRAATRSRGVWEVAVDGR